MTDVAIETTSLTKRYGQRVAVDRLDLQVEPGEIFGLLGPNGAGKTTTILMLLGLTEPTHGGAKVLGLDPMRQALEVRARVGYLPDAVGFDDGLSGRQNLRYTAALNRLPEAEAAERIARLADEVGLSDRIDDRVATYSRGMRQRLGLADALLKDPEVLILDEPTASIDPEGVRELLALIRALPQQRGCTVLLSSHLLQQVQAVCDRVGIFVDGSMVASGTVAELAALHGERLTIELEAVGGERPIDDLVAYLPGVLAVRREDRGRWIVEAQRDMRELIARTLTADGWLITHLRVRGDELSEVYHRYFAREAGGAGGSDDN